MIWAILDALMNLSYFVMGFNSIGVGGPHLWSMLVILADILLAIGAHTSNTGLMVFWQVIMMISILLLFVGLIFVIIATLIGAAFLGLSTNTCDQLINGSFGQSLNNIGQSDNLNNLQLDLDFNNLGQQFDEFSGGSNDCSDAVEAGVGIVIVVAVMAFIMPIISIYFWIVVNSLRKKIVESRGHVLPMQAHPQAFMAGNQQPVMIQQPMTMAPPGYTMEPNGYTSEKY